VRLGDDLVADPRIQRPGQRRVQQRPRIVFPQPPDHQFRQSRQVTGGDTGPEHHADRLGPQPARDERQDLRRGAVEPLLVIDDAYQRPFLGHLGQQAQGGQADQEPVRCRARTEAERGPQRVTLRRRQTLQAVQHRRAQMVQHGERQFHLRLDAPARATRQPEACPARYSKSAVLPTPGSPCTTRARLSPARTAATSRPSTAHSA
jgi:hypothetical protein